MKTLYKLTFAALLGMVIFTGCTDDKTYTGPAEARFITKSGDFYIRNLANNAPDTLNFTIQLVGTSSKDINCNIAVDPSSTAVAGTDFTVPATLTIKANEFSVTGQILGNFAGVAGGDIKTLVLNLTADGATVVPESKSIQFNLRRYCAFSQSAFEGDWSVSDVSDYNGPYNYDITLVYANVAGPNVAKIDTMTVMNLWEDPADNVYVIFNWSNPANFVFSIPEQNYFVDPTYGQAKISEISASSFSACDLKINTSYQVYVTAGFYDKVSSSVWSKITTRSAASKFKIKDLSGMKPRR